MEKQKVEQVAKQEEASVVAPLRKSSGDKKKAGGKNGKVGLIVGIIAGVILLVGAIVGIVLLVSYTTLDYANTKELADEARELRLSIDGEKSCAGLFDEVFVAFDGSEFDEYLATCRSDMAGFEEKINILSGASGVRLDDDIKEKWEVFKKSYDNGFDAWMAVINASENIRDFAQNLDGIGEANLEDMTKEKLEELAKPLLESSNEKIKEYGQEIVDKLWNYIVATREVNEAWDNYWSADAENDDNELEIYYEKTEKLDEASTELEECLGFLDGEWVDEITGLDFDAEENDFIVYFDDVYEVIEQKYEENR